MRQISPSVYQIKLGITNAYLIEDEGLTLVDTGYKGSTDKIFRIIKKAGKDPKDIKQIILTHLHLDHAGSVAEIKRRLNVPVLAHEVDADLIEKGIGNRDPTLVAPGWLNRFVFNNFIKKASTDFEAVAVDTKLKDQDELPIAGGLTVLHTPGHSAGHVALFLKAEGLLIAGDLCANIFGLALSTIYEDITLGIKSIKEVAALNFDKAVFGHGSPIHSKANLKLRKKFS